MKLTLKHVVKTARIIKTANLKEDVIEIVEEATQRVVNKTKLGVKIAMVVIDAIANEDVEKQTYELLNDVMQISNAENLSFEALSDNIESLMKENDLKGFFDKVLNSQKQK